MAFQHDEDDDEVIILPNMDKRKKFSFWDVNQSVKSILNNMMEKEGSFVHADPLTIAKRMQSLHHQDFSHRLTEIRKCIDSAEKACKKKSNSMKNVRPGLKHIDLNTLSAGNWLNDVIINEYMELLVISKPFACCVSSFFLEELQKRRKYSLPEEWFLKKYILIPVCINDHWSLLCAAPSKNYISIYSSMAVSDIERISIEKIKNYLQIRYDQHFDVTSDWKINVMDNLPRQTNAHDCGVYICMFARMILFNLSSAISPTSVTTFRSWIKKELISNILMT